MILTRSSLLFCFLNYSDVFVPIIETLFATIHINVDNKDEDMEANIVPGLQGVSFLEVFQIGVENPGTKSRK